MPKGKYVKELLQAYKNNDEKAFEKVTNRMIEDEKDKSHYRLANSFKEIANSFSDSNEMKKNNSSSIDNNYFNSLPRNDSGGADLVSIIKDPKYYLEDVVLSSENKKAINRILDEYYNSKRLKGYSLEAKRKILFCGPPGCGKTVTAQSLANEINLPLLYVHMDSLISSYLGETASNLRKVFQYAEKGRWVIFFDEFDTIGKSRDDENEHGELKRSVNTLLQMIDNFKTDNLLIAATNHQHLLDNAIWRRFDEIIYFDKPDLSQIEELLKNKFRTFKSKVDFKKISKSLNGMSHAEIERICKDAIKYCIINDIKKVDKKILEKSINEEKRRKIVYEGIEKGD